MTTTDTLPEINILLLGETGVGKSTWLNSFLNYITHPSLSIAKSSEPLLHLIPTMFTITTPDFQEVVVQVGDPSLAENLKTGESATQAAQIHSFRTPSNIINFIDTPGIGDSRGIIKDGENMESVMAVIKPLGKLHGICILLKPNEARLTLSFRFCIQELLGHLHKEAVSNIVFCFTNTRGNFYRPGESIKSLKQLVSNNLPGRSSASLGLDSGSIFCFDSEAFRYLAAYKQQQDNKDSEPLFSEDESASFEQSWKKSSAEAERMIAQIMSLTPHNLDLTLDLFRLRRYVDAITIPVVELKQKLQLEIHNLEKSREDVQQQQDATTAMVSDLFKEATILKREKLNHLNIVCTHDDCSAPHGENERHFMKICHENCTCLTTGADLNIQNQAKLLQCKELSSGSTCKVCGHPWQIHMAVDYGTKMVAEQQFNSAGAADLLVNFGKTVWKRSESDGIQRRVNELKKELQTIQDATSSLVSMLQANAVDDENDAVEEYMERLIKDVKPGDEHDALEELRDSYAIKKEAFSSVENDNDCKLDMQKVDALLDSLLSLKLSGDCLRQKVNPISEKVGGKIWQRKRCEGDDKDKCNIC